MKNVLRAGHHIMHHAILCTYLHPTTYKSKTIIQFGAENEHWLYKCKQCYSNHPIISKTQQENVIKEVTTDNK
ncbi:hypothetical protein ACHAWO_009252 [Cyclotella atomus]|uniref:Uncharacterized protein n=1 Tax=Cyclotella atomus TaxID=382360 RepID=A0ABD3Q5F1_9STRA